MALSVSGCHFSEPLLVAFRIDPAIVPHAAGYLRAISWGAPGLCLVLLLRYFSEGTGNTKPTMFYGVAGALLNIPLNYVLMFGKLGFPAMGTVGCGYATSIVIWLQFLFLLAYIATHRHYRPFSLLSRFERPDAKTIAALLKVGLPIAVAIAVEGSLFVGAALLIGQLGPVPAAAHLVAINFSALVFMVPIGLASAVSIRVGNALGRGEPEAARYAGRIGLLIILFIQTISATMMFFFPELIVRMYTDDVAVGTLAVSLLFYAAIFQYPDGIQMVMAGALRGYKDTRAPMLYTVVAFWIVGMTLGYTLTFNRGMGPAGMWIGMIAGLTVAALVVRKSLGYAGIAGVPIEYGLYAAAAGAILYAIFGLSGQIATGPSSALAAVAGSAVVLAGVSGDDAVALVAARCGEVRLIDNLRLDREAP